MVAMVMGYIICTRSLWAGVNVVTAMGDEGFVTGINSSWLKLWSRVWARSLVLFLLSPSFWAVLPETSLQQGIWHNTDNCYMCVNMHKRNQDNCKHQLWQAICLHYAPLMLQEQLITGLSVYTAAFFASFRHNYIKMCSTLYIPSYATH